MQRGAEYMESWLAGTQPIQERPKVNFMKPRTMTEIVAADVLAPDFGSPEWMDFASSFAQELKVANKPPKRKAPQMPERNPDGQYIVLAVHSSSASEGLSISGISALISDGSSN